VSRVQLSINVSDLKAAVAFYSGLFGTTPAKLRPGYANFAIDDPPLKLVLNCPGTGPAAPSITWASKSAPPQRSPRRRSGWPRRGWPPNRTREPNAATRGRTRYGRTAPTRWPGSTTPFWSTSRRHDHATALAVTSR
jgi:catechol 2,3-dioxygenase-like lactoylglutathione lyase family enzyme